MSKKEDLRVVIKPNNPPSTLSFRDFIAILQCVLLLIVFFYFSTEQPNGIYSNFKVLRKTIFLYSFGEPVEVQQAIAFTLRNRFVANRKKFGGRDLTKICLYFWGNARLNELDIPEETEEEMNLWLKNLMDGKMYDFTNGSLYFKFPDDKGLQWKEKQETIKLGRIHFFTDSSDKERIS
ncbi:hypothetical protein PFISCL1PPCAC_6855 [Pristionchus fissidentatus]|uniref:Cell wall hydrolase SleB domain-containing protein n=1 Tax=Pristionchus fissidentatus TaxID=1538716 RepID=A0AAV5V8M1_9BILA|nr:hypothetical protein PFISCL1PPCAC_6855 [Pristionchus fissidentatus]